jgi:hypothetical protein
MRKRSVRIIKSILILFFILYAYSLIPEDEKDKKLFSQSLAISPNLMFGSHIGFSTLTTFYYSRYFSLQDYNLGIDGKVGFLYNFKKENLHFIEYGIDFNYYFTSFITHSFFISVNTGVGNYEFEPYNFRISITPGYRWQWNNGINLFLGLGAGYILYQNEKFYSFKNYSERFFFDGKGAIGYSF